MVEASESQLNHSFFQFNFSLPKVTKEGLLNLAIAATAQTGREFLAQLVQEHAQIPIVVLEGHPESSDGVESRWRARLEVARLVKYRVVSPLNSPDFILQSVIQALNP